MVRINRYVAAFATVMAFSSVGAQASGVTKTAGKPADPSAKLREVLPADVADRVIARIAAARAHDLPAAALENRALKFAARGVKPADIEQSIDAQANRMEKSKAAIESGRGGKAKGDEIEAGAEAMRKGVDGAKVSELAKSAPSGRSLAVPLFVVGSLVDRGLPSDEALKRVQDRLTAKATDRELEELPGHVARGGGKPATTGQDLAATKRPGTAGKPATVGQPTGVPRNAGKGTAPAAATRGKKPE